MKKSIALMFRRLIVLFCLLVNLPQVQAQTKPSWFLEPVFHYGSIVPHHDFMESFLEGPLVSGEMKLGVQTDGRHYWEPLYGYPAYGLGFYYGNIGNRDVLGNPYAVFGFYDIPLLRTGRFRFGTQISLGLAGGFHPYDSVSNPLNLAIGSRLNVFFSYNFNLGFRLSDRLMLIQGANFTHFSNGAVTLPNTGFYLLDYYASLRYTLSPEIKKPVKPELPEPGSQHEFYTLFSAGSKKTSIGGRSWFTSTLSLGYYYHAGRISKLGLGFDLFYDTSLQRAFPEGNFSFSDILRAGIFAGHELKIDRIGIVLNQGVYVYRRVNPHQNYFSRLGIRYHFPSGIFPSIAIKSHWGKADYIEWGMGYAF